MARVAGWCGCLGCGERVEDALCDAIDIDGRRLDERSNLTYVIPSKLDLGETPASVLPPRQSLSFCFSFAS